MDAKLRVLFDGADPKEFEITDTKTYIGRGDENRITLNHSSVSRRHCVIERDGPNYRITDLKSLNGTFVNGSSANNSELKHGDKLQVGDFTILLEFSEFEREKSVTVSVTDEEISLPPNSVVVPIERSDLHSGRDLAGLLNIARTINATHDIEKLQREILEQLFEIIPASSGAIILVGEQHQFEEVVGWDRDRAGDEIGVSRTVVDRVMQEKSAILAEDVIADSRQLKSESLAIAGTVSLLCVPLILFDKILGVIYLTSDNSSVSFDDSHLRFLLAVSSISAVAIENARNFSQLKTENARLRAGTLSRAQYDRRK